MTKGRQMLLMALALSGLLGFASFAAAAGGCTTAKCHQGISDIRAAGSEMMQTIKNNGSQHGDPDGCVMCHGGNPKATRKEEAHRGIPATLKMAPGPKAFYPDPGSIWIAENSCGACHVGYGYRARLSLMNSETGKISGNLHTWGFKETAFFKNPYGNYNLKDLDGFEPIFGTARYKAYMTQQISLFPDQYPAQLKKLPTATMAQIDKDPKLAALTYQRQECQRCHIGVRGREKRGDYRGMGCSACHILYSNDGYYEGGDKTIPRDKPGHMLKHRIMGTRKTGGIPVESCNSCHNRGKRIGVSYQGLMEFPYGSPFNAKGGKQSKLHTKKYLFISDDLHHQYNSRKENPKGGLLCQDCHTSVDVHGDGNIHGTTMAQVEIECTDCHGRPDKYAWELPLGYGDEYGKKLSDKPRGVAKNRLKLGWQFGERYAAEDGFILTSRGNPFGNVVRRGNQVIVHSATGNDFKVPVLKNLSLEKKWQDPSAPIAMSAVKKHMDKMECYACHASWVPQCYGCHVKVNYSRDKKGKQMSNIDWVASGNAQKKNGQTAESVLGTGGIRSPGKAMETRSYLRWEDPILGIDGEGRVSPLMPGCQVTYTVIDAAGKTIAHNMIADSPDEAAVRHQKHIPLAIDMAQVQPHTAQRKARTCESCHTNLKSVGLGLGGGTFGARQSMNIVEDLTNSKTGKIIPTKYTVQIPGIPKLKFDWSKIVERDGTQVATVGTHWPMSRAFNKKELDTVLRAGTCMGCHQNMSKKELWAKISTEGTLDPAQHLKMMNRMIQIMAAKNIKPAETPKPAKKK